jgi:tRNA-Thr(GGU) m(6)t(6)A37 methyltransferase TsaA
VESFRFEPIGSIATPFTEVAGMPIQAAYAGHARGTLTVFDAFTPGLADLEGFSHLILLYVFDRAGPAELVVQPFLDAERRGVFATRAPTRPCPTGLSVVRLTSRRGAVLEVEGVDMLDGTPLLDIKPFVPAFDHRAAERIGWLEHAVTRLDSTRADDRFAAPPP